VPRPPFDEVLRRLRTHEGEPFHTITKKAFTYRIHGGLFRTSLTDYAVGMADVERAYRLVPLPGPGAITEIVRGPSYVWAVLHDPRIRRSDW
jgi:hypothetical protein